MALDPISEAIARITLGGGANGGYGGYGGTEAYTTGVPAAAAGPAPYLPQFEPGYKSPDVTTTGSVAGGITDNNPAGAGGFWDGFKWNKDTFGLALGGLQTIGSLWGAWQANKLANEQFKFSKDFALKNLSNQTTAYNTELEGRTRARAFTEGLSDQDAKNYVEAHRLAQM